MLSPEEMALIRANIERLEKARDYSTDSGIRELIDAWIEEHRQRVDVRQESNVARYHCRSGAVAS
jgi:hypothetical protein